MKILFGIETSPLCDDSYEFFPNTCVSTNFRLLDFSVVFSPYLKTVDQGNSY